MMFNKDLKQEYPAAIKFLELAITNDQLANSYLFIGNNVKQIQSVVVNLAKILNCTTNKDNMSNPCNLCINCKWLDRNEHPNALITIEPEFDSKKEQIKVEAIRELLERLNVSSDSFRVIFFKKANLNTLSQECCNLLLKVVEESPGRTIFIFSNQTKSEILQTIVSRSQIIYFTSTFNFSQNIEEDLTSSNFEQLSDSQKIKESKSLNKLLEDKDVSLKDYLMMNLMNEYKNLNLDKLEDFIYKHDIYNKAFNKSKAFMQQKVIIEDLALES